ncbi:MAG: FtsW/RodA/SpoVE family cell cycle protein, partial [Ethanoligenens sp.]
TMFIFKKILVYIQATDHILILLTTLATIFGFVLIDSATQGSVRMLTVQTIGMIIGYVAMVIISQIDYHDIAGAWKVLAIISIFFLILTIVIGSSRAGSQDRAWIRIGSNTIQPSEFIKIIFAITFAKHYDLIKEQINKPRNVVMLTLHAMVPIVLLLLQRDMGMLLVYTLMFACMMFAANVKLRYFSIAGLAILISGPIIWSKILGATQKNRILSLFDPVKYSTDAYQQTQGRLAIGSGGLLGEGLFHGQITQGIASQLPEKQNDMIFAVAGEELGFIGCVAILVIFLFFLIRLIQIARKSKDAMGCIICIGVFASFAVQVGVNVAAALMFFPITGISLPFFSYGGSSIISCFAAVGIALSVYMHRSTSIFSDKPKQKFA